LRTLKSLTGDAFMVSLSNHEGIAPAVLRRFMVRQAHHEALFPAGCQQHVALRS